MAAICSVVMLAACKKNDNVANANIVGVWMWDKEVNRDKISGITKRDSTVFTGTGSFWDFRANGKVYSKTRTGTTGTFDYDTLAYSVSGNALTFIESSGGERVADILTATNTKLVLYGKIEDGSGDIEESWQYFSK